MCIRDSTKVVMREVTTIHSSVWYGKDIGHPSHAQTNNIGTSKGIAYMHKPSKNNHIPWVVTYMTKCLKNSVGNKERNRFRKRKVEDGIWL